jgi:uncharacterized protein
MESINKSNIKKPFVVMAKPVGSRCNMHCSYCYYLEKGQFSSHKKQSRMSFDLLEKLIRQTIESNSGPVVSFTWHGGEPTLAGIDFYQKAVELEKKYLPKGWQVWNNLQTNGILLNDRWCRFLKDNRFDVGLSIDGSKAVHDANRKDMGGTGTFDRVKSAALRLSKCGIKPDLLCTVNSETVKHPVEVYNELRSLGTGWMQFIPIVVKLPDGSFSKESVTPEDYGNFLCTVFDIWCHNDLGKLDVQLFAETARIMAGGKPSLCWMSETCGRVLIAEEDGSVYSCDHFVDDEHRIGSLSSSRLSSVANSDFQIQFGNSKKDSLTDECKSCPWLKFCNGGCMKDRFSYSSTGEYGQYYLCAGLKMFFSHAYPMLQNIMELSKKGNKPDKIMELINS